MTENMKAFMDALKNNEELKKKFDEISNKEQTEQKDYNDEYIALAKECGITLTDEDFEHYEGELSDEDLQNVSGGGTKLRRVTKKKYTTPKKSQWKSTSGGDFGTGEETESE